MMKEYFCFLGWRCWCWNFCPNTNAYVRKEFTLKCCTSLNRSAKQDGAVQLLYIMILHLTYEISYKL